MGDDRGTSWNIKCSWCVHFRALWGRRYPPSATEAMDPMPLAPSRAGPAPWRGRRPALWFLCEQGSRPLGPTCSHGPGSSILYREATACKVTGLPVNAENAWCSPDATSVGLAGPGHRNLK